MFGLHHFYIFLKLFHNKSYLDENILTDNHSLIIFNKENNETEFRYASQLKVGDLTRTSGGINEVVEINKELKKNVTNL